MSSLLFCLGLTLNGLILKKKKKFKSNSFKTPGSPLEKMFSNWDFDLNFFKVVRNLSLSFQDCLFALINQLILVKEI